MGFAAILAAAAVFCPSAHAASASDSINAARVTPALAMPAAMALPDLPGAVGALPSLPPAVDSILGAAEAPAAVVPKPSARSAMRRAGQAASRSAQPSAEGSEGVVADLSSFYDQSSAKAKKGIPEGWVDAMIERGRAKDDGARRLADAVQRVGFRQVALNREILDKHDGEYTVEIPMGKITDQQQSGRCWLFGGLNMIRSMLIADKRVPKDFEFSENYLHFFNMLEKANRHIEEMTEKLYRRRSDRESFDRRERRMTVTPDIGDGGWPEYFLFLVSKYGLVPKSAMKETISSENTGMLLNELDDSLGQTAIELLANAQQYKAGRAPNLSQRIKSRGMDRVWRILATHLGEPPKTFQYRLEKKTKTFGRVQVTPTRLRVFTPKTFAQKFVKFDPDDYIVVASYPGKKPETAYEMKNTAIGAAAPGQKRFDLRFLNVTSERLEEVAAEAIKGGQPVPFSADIHQDVDYRSGIMHPRLFDRKAVYQLAPADQSAELSRKEKSYLGRISANHLMLLTGLDRPDRKGPFIKFKVENSWGEGSGSKGVYHLYHEWFLSNVFNVLVHRKFLSPRELKIWRRKATSIRDGADWY